MEKQKRGGRGELRGGRRREPLLVEVYFIFVLDRAGSSFDDIHALPARPLIRTKPTHQRPLERTFELPLKKSKGKKGRLLRPEDVKKNTTQ